MAGRGRKTGVQYLRWFRIADGEVAVSLNIAAGVVFRAADETEVILPAQWKCHVLRCQIERTILVPGSDENQRRHHKTSVPDGSAGIKLDDVGRRLAHDKLSAGAIASFQATRWTASRE